MFDNLDNLIYKIYKFLTDNDKSNIKRLITSTKTDANLQINMDKISRIILRYVTQLKLKKDISRQDFIVQKIMAFLTMNAAAIVNSDLTAIDIGGGNGNILSGINNMINGDKLNFTCVENVSEWSEYYEFNHSNISYLFWDNHTMAIPDNSCDLAFCMVSLHHMSDETINNSLLEIHRIVKSGGILMIKEHDANSVNTKQLIEWEHHLYHILDCAYNGQTNNFELYKKQTISNFKSKETWQKIIEMYGFKFTVRTNRFLDGTYYNNDVKNVTNLYWDTYVKL